MSAVMCKNSDLMDVTRFDGDLMGFHGFMGFDGDLMGFHVIQVPNQLHQNLSPLQHR